MTKKQFLSKLFLTFLAFVVIMTLFFTSREGKGVVLDVNLPFLNNKQVENTSTQESNPSQNNPNYGDLTDTDKQVADIAIGNLLNNNDANLTPSDITVVSVEKQDFNDASLGCPKPDQTYAQVITPGYKVILFAKDNQYDFRLTEDMQTVEQCLGN